MRAELYRPEEPDRPVAVATWDGRSARLEVLEGAPEGTAEVLRPTPVVVEDPSLRRLGTHGEVLLHPGTFEWFREALRTRAEGLGLAVRFVPVRIEGGWDPAATYRTFEEQVERITAAA
jgi:hypothetical protein